MNMEEEVGVATFGPIVANSSKFDEKRYFDGGVKTTTTATRTEEEDEGDEDPVIIDPTETDYRGFILVVHPNHGLLLLHCTRKKNKPPHYQLPGGHVDQEEFDEAVANLGSNATYPTSPPKKVTQITQQNLV